MNQLVSIIVPIYNKENFLDKLIVSLVNQTYKNLEILLVDDGSTDDSLKKCEFYKDERIKVLHQTNGGVSSARNFGLRNATGDYIAFVDADDYIEPNYIKTMVTNIENHDMCECGYNRVDENGTIIESVKMREEVLDEKKKIQFNYLNYNNACDILCNKMLKKSVIGDIGFSTKYKCSEDYLFLAQVLANVNSKITIPDALYNYVSNDKSVGNEAYSEKKLDVLRAREEAFAFYANDLSYMVATQIMYQCKVLYPIADECGKQYIKKIFKKYYKYLYKVKCNMIKKIYRILIYSIFYIKMSSI